jgi:hypothetical protein
MIWRRIRLFVLCLGVGLMVAVLGQALWPSDAWWLALPAALALGWLLVADPSRCEPRR